MKRLVFLFAALLLLLGSPINMAYAVDYFVDGLGDDLNDGLAEETPFRTITHAMSLAAAGDRIFVSDGFYTSFEGETFPIVMADGVSLIGPGDGSATVNAVADATAVFQIGALTQPTTISGLKIQATLDNPGVCIAVTDMPASLHVIGNEIAGDRGLSNMPGGPPSAPAGGSPNIVFASNVVEVDDIGFLWTYRNVAAAHTLSINNNTVVGAPVGLVVYGFSASTGQLAANVEMIGNQVSSAGFFGIGLLTVANPASGVAVAAHIEDNTLNHCNTGILLRGRLTGTAATAALNLTVRSNMVSSGQAEGIFCDFGAVGTSAHLSVQGVIECNRVTSAASSGGDPAFRLRLNAESAAMIDCEPAIQNNIFAKHEIGFLAQFTAATSAVANGDALVRGNTIRDNRRDGVRLSSSAGTGASVMLPDFGGRKTPGAPGLNTILRNDRFFLGSYDFNVAGVPGATVYAEGNWWEATSTTAIEMEINDVADNSAFGDLLIDPFLTDPLEFTAATAAQNQLITIKAKDGTVFLDKAADQLISVKIGAVDGVNPTVTDGGRKMTIIVPNGVILGDRDLVIVNPGGQSGVERLTLISATSGSGGICFIATAAFGDVDSPTVSLLRRWRDESLATNPLGRALVNMYYESSPGAAQWIAERPAARALMRAALAPIAGAARLWLEWPAIYLLGAGALLWRLLRRKAG